MIAGLFAAAISVEAGWGVCRPADGPVPVLVEAVGDEAADVRGRLQIHDARSNSVVLPLELSARSHKRWRIALPASATIAGAQFSADVGEALVKTSTPSQCGGPVLAILDRAAGTAVRFPLGGDPKSAISAGRLTPEDLDAPWQTLESLDAIEAEARALSELSQERFFALRTWVLEGGLLIVVPGPDPAPLAASGRLPSAVDLQKGELGETPWGEGAIVTAPQLAPDPEGTLAGSLRARVRRSQVDRAGARLSRALLRRQMEAQTGPGAMGGGTGLVGLGLLAGLVLIVHEVLRRRRVVKAVGLRQYAIFVAGSIAAMSVAAWAVARIGASEVRGGGVRVIAEGAPLGRLLMTVALLPGDLAPIAPDAVVEADTEITVTLGNPPRVSTEGSVARAAATVAAWDPGGAIRIARVPGGWRIDNGTRVSLGAGTLADGVTVYEIPAIAGGDSVSFSKPMRLAPELPVLAPFSADGPVYLAPAEDGWVVVHMSERR